MAVILNMVGFDTTTPINCQVSPVTAVSHISSLKSLIIYHPEVWVTFEVVSTRLNVARPRPLISPFSSYLVIPPSLLVQC